MNIKQIIPFLLVNVSVCPAALAESVMQPGGWEMHAKVVARNSEGGETKNLSDATHRVCLTPAFLAKDPYLTPGLDKEAALKKGATCTISDEQTSSGAASWKMNCRMSDGMVTEGTVKNSASAKELHSEIAQVATKDGNVLKMTITMTGRHVGECKPDMVEM